MSKSLPADSFRVAIIKAVATPLNFLVLGLLVFEGVLTGLILSLGEPHRSWLVWALIFSIPAFILIVVGVAIFQPEALSGNRPLQEAEANRLAITLYGAFDGPLRNLEPSERIEAWITAVEMLTNDDEGGITFSRFSGRVAAQLELLANIKNRPRRTPGPVQTSPKASSKHS